MNFPVLIVAIITLLAFGAHVLVGARETASIKPDEKDAKLNINWVQAMCAFQMLSVDLLAVSALLFAIAIFDLGKIEGVIILVAIGLYVLWGMVWIVQMVWLKTAGGTLLILPQWLIWFICAGFLTWGYSTAQ